MKVIIVSKQRPVDTRIWDLSKVASISRFTYNNYPENPASILSLRLESGLEISYSDDLYDFYRVTMNLTREKCTISDILETWSHL